MKIKIFHSLEKSFLDESKSFSEIEKRINEWLATENLKIIDKVIQKNGDKLAEYLTVIFFYE